MSTPSAGVPRVRGLKVPLGGQLSDLGYAAGWQVVRAMPEFAARNAFDAGARYASRNGGRKPWCTHGLGDTVQPCPPTRSSNSTGRR